MCLENCLMIGVMMPVGVSCLSTLSPGEKQDEAQQAPHPRLDAQLRGGRSTHILF